MSNTTLDQVRQIAADVFNVPLAEVTPEFSPDTCDNWDSLRHVNLVLALEQSFSVEFTPEEIEQMLSIQTVVTVLEEKLLEAV